MAFDSLKPTNDVLLVAEPIRAGNTGRFADAELVATLIYSELGPAVLDRLAYAKSSATWRSSRAGGKPSA